MSILDQDLRGSMTVSLHFYSLDVPAMLAMLESERKEEVRVDWGGMLRAKI